MLYNKAEIKVRYGETDQMGIVNNAVYPSWFEIGRTELFDQLKLPYSEMEKNGILLPLSELHIKYHSPAYYGDIVTIETRVEKMPAVRVVFDYKIYFEDRLITTGQTIQAFMNAKTRKPMRIPESLKNALEKYFE